MKKLQIFAGLFLLTMLLVACASIPSATPMSDNTYLAINQNQSYDIDTGNSVIVIGLSEVINGYCQVYFNGKVYPVRDGQKVSFSVEGSVIDVECAIGSIEAVFPEKWSLNLH